METRSAFVLGAIAVMANPIKIVNAYPPGPLSVRRCRNQQMQEFVKPGKELEARGGERLEQLATGGC